MKKIYSIRDKNGKLWVNCAECERGGNGKEHDCSCGWKVKSGKRGLGCMVGKPMQVIAENAPHYNEWIKKEAK